MQMQPQRYAPGGAKPTGVVILGVLEVLGGISSILVGIYALATIFGFGAAGDIEFGLIGLIVGAGLLRGKAWSWVAALILVGVEIIGGIITIAVLASDGVLTVLAADTGGSVISIVIAVIIGYYLTRPQVMSFFGVQSIAGAI